MQLDLSHHSTRKSEKETINFSLFHKNKTKHTQKKRQFRPTLVGLLADTVDPKPNGKKKKRDKEGRRERQGEKTFSVPGIY